EQGIASGGPYDNAAAYPKAVAILVGCLLAALMVFGRFFSEKSGMAGLAIERLRRPAWLLGIFAVFLWSLGYFGYHISTPPMLMALMILGGLRHPLEILAVGFGASIFLAFVFEVFLKIVLPGGIFALNIPW
ncbi:MAG: tripartite tricarboxylate transporter TctB family protein, partial [Geminicoccaceae bacterium]